MSTGDPFHDELVERARRNVAVTTRHLEALTDRAGTPAAVVATAQADADVARAHLRWIEAEHAHHAALDTYLAARRVTDAVPEWRDMLNA